MKNIRVQRLEHELRQRLYARRDVFKEALLALYFHPKAWPGLHLGNIALMREFREVMCAPANVTVTKDSFDVAAAQMAKYGKRLDALVRNELLGLVSKLRKKAKSDASPDDAAPQDEEPLGAEVLSLATTCFRCKVCQRGLFYPNVTKHACLRKQPLTVEASDIYGQFVAKQVPATWTHELPVNVVDVLEAREPYCCSAEVLKLCGKDVEKVTAEEMDAVPDLRFVMGKRTVLTWRAMVGF